MPITFPHPAQPNPSSPSSESSFDEEEEVAMIQEEWEESLRQMEVVFSIIVLPFFGKWYGRRFSYWAFARWQTFGWTRALFGIR